MNENECKFLKLTPIDYADLEIYESAIDFVFKNDDVRNIAVSGAYGSGKSSILASYKKKHNEIKLLHISLAHFESLDTKNEEGNGSGYESFLERKVLNQLIHQIPSKKIPQTNFHVIRHIQVRSILWNTFLMLLLLISLAHVMFFEKWKSYVLDLNDNEIDINNSLQYIFDKTSDPLSLIVSGCIIITVIFIAIFKLIKLQKSRNIFRKFNFQGNEIEIFKETEDSYFDKYLNDVLYLFENSGVDGIVYEDIDRFCQNEVFERLREINTLANIQLEKNKQPIIRFFYLLRDDIFASKDRTKFFDFIIPIIPVIDASNSYDKFIQIFENGGIIKEFDKSFLQGLSLYIDDMRILKNIYNEFLIYNSKLNITNLSYNKMLAIIAYKNLFPKDFSALQLNQGYVYSLFCKKDKFINMRIEEMQEEINIKQQEITLTKEEHLQSLREVDTLFATIYLGGYGSSWIGYNDNELSEWVSSLLRRDSLETYKRRRKNVKNKLDNSIIKYESAINRLKSEIQIIQNKQLKEIITRENRDEIFNFISQKDSENESNYCEIISNEYFDLLKYLISYGYIDETYPDYMTYFYENSISRIDKTFLRSVTDKRAQEYTYKLKNPKLVISRLRLVDFEQEEILNYDLFDYLLKTPENLEYLSHFIGQLKETQNFRFVSEYLNYTTQISLYIKNMNLLWPEMFYTIVEDDWFSTEQVLSYSIYTLYYSDDNEIINVDKDNCLREYISNSEEYLDIDSPNIDKLIKGFNLLDVSFKRINYDACNKILFDAVYKNSLYEINYDNIRLILQHVYNVSDEGEIKHKNYTLILSDRGSALSGYIHENIVRYINVITETCDSYIMDDEEAVLHILDNESVTLDQKREYIKNLKTVISYFKNIEDKDLWDILIENNIIEFSGKNIMDYFSEIGSMNNRLIYFINSGKKNIDFSQKEEMYKHEDRKALFDAIIECNAIENEKYREILKSLNFYYDEFSVTGIDSNKIRILIDENIIRMNMETLAFFKENYLEEVLYFINKNISQYVEKVNRDMLGSDELLEILDWDIADELKIKLLELTDEEISILDKSYSSRVCAEILKSNCEPSDLPRLFEEYEECDKSIQDVILHISEERILDVIDNVQTASDILKMKILNSNSVLKEEKVKLFVAMMHELNKSEIMAILMTLKIPKFIEIFDIHKRPRFEINDMNEALLVAFKEKGLILDFKEDTSREGYYSIKRNSLKEEIAVELFNLNY